MPDLNAKDKAWAMKIVQWSARAIGITTDIDWMTKQDIDARNYSIYWRT